MDKTPWFPFYADDFLVGTMDMSDAEVGIYIRLLALEWAKGPLTEHQTHQCGRKRALIRTVIDLKFDSYVDDVGQKRYINLRLENERKLMEQKRKRKAEAGTKGARSRWQPHDSANGNTTTTTTTRDIEEESSSNSLDQTSGLTDSDSDQSKSSKFKYSKAFSEWWEHYPRKVSKKAAHEAYKRAGARLRSEHDWTSKQTIDFLLSRVKAFAASPMASRGDRQFIPHPATWLNGGRYDDDESEWDLANQEGSSPKPFDLKAEMAKAFGEDGADDQ
ncbi:hypothetical protein Pan216_21190 [Planctomycetes bacterium Pan216]|uniref:DUF1376 domain-containing protein n=1 Tax=Kolteria novifilia TaxID=2527975 RepID=A0A518B2R4_9BACT|nr:hypothetical protein Pan216_21190 [Planctomycetes bacterium Pan216]